MFSFELNCKHTFVNVFVNYDFIMATNSVCNSM